MATKTAVRSLYKAIRHGDLEMVRTAIAQDPTLANSCAIAPPKKDDGQSPLQVAIKTGNHAIANFLLDAGAAVNFMESSTVNEWRAPVLHDAIRAAVFSAGFDDLFEPMMAVLTRMLTLGADARAVDSYGNSTLDRALLDANQISYGVGNWPEPKPRGIEKVIGALRAHGADPAQARIRSSLGFSVVVARFLPDASS